jgi:hypothetical protein
MNNVLSRRFALKGGLALTGNALLAQEDFTKLPANLPVPIDDGACDHLLGMVMPSILLRSTHGDQVDLARHGMFPLQFSIAIRGQENRASHRLMGGTLFQAHTAALRRAVL